MLWPFEKKPNQKKFGIVAGIVGVIIMLSGINYSYLIGLVIAGMGVMYLLEAVS